MNVAKPLILSALLCTILVVPASALGPYCGTWCSNYPSSQVCYCYPTGLRTTCGNWPCACDKGFPCQAAEGSPLPQEPADQVAAELPATAELMVSPVQVSADVEKDTAAPEALPFGGCYVETDCAGCCPTISCSGSTYCKATTYSVECDGHYTRCPKDTASCC